jgi:hypothetical protein
MAKKWNPSPLKTENPPRRSGRMMERIRTFPSFYRSLSARQAIPLVQNQDDASGRLRKKTTGSFPVPHLSCFGIIIPPRDEKNSATQVPDPLSSLFYSYQELPPHFY